MTPGSMIDKIRAYAEATGQPSPGDVGALVRCCLESLALRYRSVAEALDELTGRPLTTIRVVGGGSQNNVLNRFTADACQRVVVTGPSEATALGNLGIVHKNLGRFAEAREHFRADLRLSREIGDRRGEGAWPRLCPAARSQGCQGRRQ